MEKRNLRLEELERDDLKRTKEVNSLMERMEKRVVSYKEDLQLYCTGNEELMQIPVKNDMDEGAGRSKSLCCACREAVEVLHRNLIETKKTAEENYGLKLVLEPARENFQAARQLSEQDEDRVIKRTLVKVEKSASKLEKLAKDMAKIEQVNEAIFG